MQTPDHPLAAHKAALNHLHQTAPSLLRTRRHSHPHPQGLQLPQPRSSTKADRLQLKACPRTSLASPAKNHLSSHFTSARSPRLAGSILQRPASRGRAQGWQNGSAGCMQRGAGQVVGRSERIGRQLKLAGQRKRPKRMKVVASVIAYEPRGRRAVVSRCECAEGRGDMAHLFDARRQVW